EACERGEPRCDRVALLSRLERRAVERVVADRGLELEPSPQGRRIRRVVIVNQDVFGPADGFLRWFNLFHVTSREEVVARELVIGAGEPWDDRKADESLRRLRDALFTSLAAIVAVRTDDPDQVDLLCVTRDVWSLRLNSNYELQQSQLTYLSFALSENNLFGARKLLAASFKMDQGAYTMGPLYIDKNLLGRHLDLRGTGGPIFNRQSGHLEGSQSTLQLSYPLWTLTQDWGAGLEVSHRFAVERSFRGTGLRTYDAPETPVDDSLPYQYQQRRIDVAASVVRAFGSAVEQRVRGGYELAVRRPSLVDGFPADPVLIEAFTRDVLPRSERTSSLFVGYQLFEPRYRNFQDVDTFELAEDTQMGVAADVKLSAALGLLGSEHDFLRVAASASYTGQLGADGLWKVKVAGSTRLEGGEAVDDVAEVNLRLVAPTFEVGRVVSQLRVAGLFRDRQNQFYTLGGDNGLRGYPVGELSGDRVAVWNTELRTHAVPVWFMRWGLLAFYDVGGADASLRTMQLHHDAGLGLRILTPQFNPEVYRFDFAFGLDGDRRGEFRFIGGYTQAF
ncbi:MAG: BamA/TamA family outer membrane protein, partial [Myxococcales bacterium]|nr:BamA/TamA family outer membrane protein [Myxococcales bacterium]